MSAEARGTEEGKGFLDPTIKKNEEVRRPWWKTRRFFYCIGCVFGSILAVFLAGLIMYFVRLNSGTFNNEEGKEWETKLLTDGQSSNFSGMYEMVRHDEHYESYLLALGIPYLVVKLILVSSEILVFDVPLDMNNGEWILTTKAGPTDQISKFKLNEPFIVSMRKGKTVLNTTATMPSNDTMVMDSISQKSGNHLISSFTFTANGLINTRVFVSKNITTKKFYKRIEQEDLDADKDSSPFSDIEEDDEDDDFFEWDD